MITFTITTNLPFGLFSSATLSGPIPKISENRLETAKPVDRDETENDEQEDPKPFWED